MCWCNPSKGTRMTKEEMIELAKQAGFYINDELTITSPFIEDICISPMLKEFAKLVAEKEREECAKRLEAVGCHHCAENIRRKGEE